MINYQKKDIERGIFRTTPEMGLPAFNDICPHCERRQKWNAKKNKDSPKPVIDWEFEEDNIQNEEESEQMIKSDTGEGSNSVYETLINNPHINLRNIISFTQNDETNPIIVQERVDGETLAVHMQSDLTNDTFIDFLLQISDVMIHLQNLSRPIGFKNLYMDDIIVCEGNQVKISNLQVLEFSTNIKDGVNLIIQMIQQAPKKIARRYRDFLQICENQPISPNELRQEIIALPLQQKRIKMYIFTAIIIISVIFRRFIGRLFF